MYGPSKMKSLARDAFMVTDQLNGSLSGGIEGPKHIIGISSDRADEATVRWQYPRTAGLSDRVYHCSDRSIHETTYRVVNGRLTADGLAVKWKTVFDGDRDVISDFIRKWGISVPET